LEVEEGKFKGFVNPIVVDEVLVLPEESSAIAKSYHICTCEL
jgi:hypothetical protein